MYTLKTKDSLKKSYEKVHIIAAINGEKCPRTKIWAKPQKFTMSGSVPVLIIFYMLYN